MDVNNDDSKKFALDVWKEAQAQQRTFNDLLFRIRNIAFVFAGVALGGVGTLSGKNPSLLGYLLISASIPWLSLYLLDRYYYHLLLMAAVRVSEDIEHKFLSQYGIPSLSTTITNLNRSNPIPLIGARTGRMKVTVFYALPLISGLTIGFYLVFKSLLIVFLIPFVIGVPLFLLEKDTQCQS